jgi:hypothetical protein
LVFGKSASEQHIVDDQNLKRLWRRVDLGYFSFSSLK